ncbi:hypothetical protein GCM10011505_09770 [Tistrella bauzanensis]|uniref:Uncharacterized protein n=1 Tax=Tistrella bauzanensis TaxID=657419 RepID=A0ABQ1IBQ0_9PROT|nr:hypothetical protein GCM10011505_09770 [Tistrella bauzanensis]
MFGRARYIGRSHDAQPGPALGQLGNIAAIAEKSDVPGTGAVDGSNAGQKPRRLGTIEHAIRCCGKRLGGERTCGFEKARIGHLCLSLMSAAAP